MKLFGVFFGFVFPNAGNEVCSNAGVEHCFELVGEYVDGTAALHGAKVVDF